MRGTIRARGKGRWQVQVYAGRRPDGTEHRVARTVHGGRRDADSALNRLIAEVEAGQHTGDDLTVAQLAEQWYQARLADWSPSTAREYRHQIDTRIVPAIGRRPARKIRARDLDLLYAQLRGQGLAATTVAKTHSTLSSMFGQAARWHLVGTNPARDANKPELDGAPIDPPTPAGVARLLGELAERLDLFAFMRTAATTGARRGELCALQWTDLELDLTAGHAVVTRALADGGPGIGIVVRPTTKTKRSKVLALDAATVHALLRWRTASAEIHLRAGAPMKWVFPSPRDLGRPIRPDTISQWWYRNRDRFDMGEVTFGQMRHFMATQLLAAGVDVRTVAGRMGHSNPATLLRVYAHFIPEADRAAADTIAGLLDSG